ncbi:MAG: hypothetical protein ACI90V_012586, partial [Bacillariaceae sp.]
PDNKLTKKSSTQLNSTQYALFTQMAIKVYPNGMFFVPWILQAV